ncbi:MAG: Gfo/Idh/MocA family oxidoreductase [Actinobacteria bacterium]|nr:Gfo/Idh/MocA family oxidoreductase [Actinomycetota bacterium]
MPRTRAAVVGLGDISALHLDAITANPSIELVAVCDVDAERCRTAAERLGVPGFADHRALLASVRVDVVHVTTPHHQHVPVALDALEAGVAVLTEKPVGHTVASAEELRARAAASAVKVGVVFQNRYNPTSVALRRALDDGLIGPVQGARAAVWWSRTAAYYAAAPWRGRWAEGGGGVLINQAIHTLDLLLWLLGEPVWSSGSAATLALAASVEVEDTATIVLEHAGGVRSTFFATNTHHRNDDVELEIVGARGVLRLAGGEARLRTASGETVLASDTQAGGQRSYWGRGHALLIDDFHARLADPEPFWIGLDAGLAPLRVLREVYRRSGLLPAGQEL